MRWPPPGVTIALLLRRQGRAVSGMRREGRGSTRIRLLNVPRRGTGF